MARKTAMTRKDRFFEAIKRKQKDLRVFGVRKIGIFGSVVSEILNGKREMNLRQVRALAKRFGVSPEVFI
jgi:HTH-type transcriptional regulator/antitoxin HigA